MGFSSNIHDVNMEQCVLAALMTTALSLETIGQELDVECFYSDRHQQIYKAIVELSESNCPYDVVMVSNHLKGKNVLHLMGGEEYLIQLMQDAPSSFYNAESYITQLNKLKTHRRIEQIGLRIAAMAKDTTLPDVFVEAENLLGQVDKADDADMGASFGSALDSALEQMIDKFEKQSRHETTGVKFNLKTLDEMLGTVQNGHFCVVGGRPGSGKSTLAQMMAIDTAMLKKEGVLFISAEMDKETLSNRMFSSLSSIPYNNLHNATLYDGLLKEYANYKQVYSDLPIWIEPKQKPSISEVRAYARRAKRRFSKMGTKLGCIIVDYLQLVRDPSKKDRFQEVGSISRELKSMAKEFECPVVALVQLNRESEKGKKPKASDIKESGQIEQDADQIILVNPLTDDKTLQPLGVTELIIAKNRHGKRGSVRVQEFLDVCKFKAIEVTAE
ncbi:putative replicative DNA helicase [Acinetobacter baumannii]|uniref:replicative DNA helicase n=1 Tax=Acinetobacter baumannii TaxID=470 RepID=UPI000DE68097|nr:DnaB-like helicase C-terminal domain-containing protein [Acinetobacter baumannii]SSS23523.1 putative replicative DNA helicase [Acinetobacter baumannii]SSS37319.1 putative replicative DNA helicase [Acinetobacter baumannii]SSS98048.1 putative replicative DNA helicase [Acinetobacter baumannii]SST33564.1 putative replicative DNA helicase [Acinetobacter baumannii]SSU44595.1 putative replicative DNA helicase [Acinetobacter baumannii]